MGLRACFALLALTGLGCEASTVPLGPGGLVPERDAGCADELVVSPLGHLAPTTQGAFRWGATAALASDGLYFVDADTGAILRWRGGAPVDRIASASPGGRTILIGGAASRVAWAETVDGDKPKTEVFLAKDGVSARVASTPAVSDPFPDALFAYGVEGARVAFATRATIEVAGEGLDVPLATLLPLRPSEPPFLRWPHLAVTGYDGRARRVVVFDVSDGWRAAELVSADVHAAAIADGALFYLDGEVAMRAPLGPTLEPQPLSQKRCTSLDTDGARVLFACDPEPAAIGSWIARHATLALFDGRALVPIDLGGRFATHARIRGDLVAYLAYDETDFCTGPALARVIVQRLSDGAVVEVGRASHGCYCCDAYWPAPELLFDGERVAWSYDVFGEPSPLNEGWGMARVEAACR